MSTVFPTQGQTEYFALLRIGDVRLSTDPRVYEGNVWQGALGQFPVPRSAFRNQAGIQPSERLTVSINDPDRTYELLAESWYGEETVLILRTERTFLDGTDGSFQYRLKMQVVGYSVSGITLELQLADATIAAWDTLFPPHTWTTDDFPNLYPDSQGLVVPETAGFARKVPCARLQDEPTVYGLCLLGSRGIATVTALYRNDAVIATDQSGQLKDSNGNLVATVGTLFGASTGIEVVTLTFENYWPGDIVITADYDGIGGGANARNVSREIDRIMQHIGLTIDPTSLADSITESDANEARLDVVYTRQRTAKAIIEELLFFARANLEAREDGNYNLVHDKLTPGFSSYDETVGQKVQFNGYGRTERPSKIIVQYGTNPRNRNEFFHTIERTVPGGTGGTPIPYQVAYCQTWENVDRLISYLARREEYNRTASADIYTEQRMLGDRVHITPIHGPAIDWMIRGIERDVDANALTLQEYNDAVYTYIPGIQPADPSAAYQPDYSSTPPAAPTGLTVTDSGAEPDETGTVWSWVELECAPPAINWTTIRFVARDDGNNTLQTELSTDVGGGKQGARVSNLRPNQAQTIFCFAINENNIEGLPSANVAHTSAKDNTIPPLLTGVTISQGKGKVVKIAWDESTEPDRSYYRIARQPNGGNWSAIEKDLRANTYSDTEKDNLAYGSTYKYRVRVYDTSGNASDWTESNTLVLDRNIGNDDGDTGDPFDADTMITDRMTAKKIRTSSGSPRIEINWGLDNEIEIFDNVGNLIGDFGYLQDAGDVFVMRLGNSTFDGFCYSGINRSSVFPTGALANSNGPAFSCDSTSASQTANFIQRGSGDCIDCSGDLDINNGSLFLGSFEFRPIGSVCRLLSAEFDVVNGNIVSRQNIAAYNEVWIGWTGSGNNAIRMDHATVTNQLRIYAPGSTTRYKWFDFDTKTEGWSAG